MARTSIVHVAVLLLLGACADEEKSQPDVRDGAVTVIADGFDHPTQLADGPGGIVLVAQLAGAEDARTGEVIAFDPNSGDRRVLVSGLDKPTGVLWRDGELWIMVRRGLSRVSWTGPDDEPGAAEPVLEDLEFNGRSEGTLTALADGRFLYETSGALEGESIVEGSGTLWAFDPVRRTSVVVAEGAKNAYAHAVLPDGRILTTEIGDNIDAAPLEELNVFSPNEPVDLGWPHCAGDQVCVGVVTPVALFPRASTPTGVAVVGDDAYVALFVTGELIRVPLDDHADGGDPVTTVVVAEGLEGPHTVLERADGSLWVTEHFSGRILSFAP